MFAVTEITPSIRPSAAACAAIPSSPEKILNELPLGKCGRISCRRSIGVASLMPIMLSIFERATVVSTLMSQAVRPGTLYKITGSGTARAICSKWA